MNPRYSKQKGNAGEREIAELLTQLSGVKYRRVPMSGGIHSWNPWDIMKEKNEPSVFDGVGVEVKNTKQLSMPDWIEQVRISAEDSNMFNPKWVICFKHKGQWFFTLNRVYFEDLVIHRKHLTD
jgi:Holliday junction resolvase